MDRSRARRAATVAVTLVAAALPFGVLAGLLAAPAIVLAGAGLAWVLPLASGLVAVTASLTTIAWLALGLRAASPRELLRAGASASLAGAAIAALASGAVPAAPIAATAALLALAAAPGTDAPLRSRGGAIAAAAGALLVAEAGVVLEVLPPTAGVIDAYRDLLLAAGLGLAVAAALVRLERGAVPWLVAIGAGGLLADRGGTAESMVALAALLASQLVALRGALDPPRGADEVPETLPELASRLADAVLRFDGRLRLRDWNAAAASLLGLDAEAPGTRMEDLFGIGLPDLPALDSTTTSHTVVGGLEVALHRSGAGITAVMRDPGTAPEADRLAAELRSTIEELLRARRTIDLQRGELERSATVDPLTGVASRGAIIERLRLEVAQARRYRHPLAVVLLDVDGFGEINRMHGIGGGDAVLREVALRFRLRVRDADALGRAGSDGFLATLPHTDEGGAATFADALRHRLALRPVGVGDATLQITVSIGVATMRPGEDLDADGLLARVEEALDSARSAGGDRIALDRLHGLARLSEAGGDATSDSGELPGG